MKRFIAILLIGLNGSPALDKRSASTGIDVDTDYVLNPRGSDDQSRERKRPVPHPSFAVRALIATQGERGFKV